MKRRAFVVSAGCCFLSSLAGCVGQEESDDDDEPSANGDHREVRIEAENFVRESDNQIIENDNVTVSIELRNTGTEVGYLDITLQMRDRNGADLGSPYTRHQGPIEPEEIIEVRFDVEQREEEIGGYELVVRGASPQNGDDGNVSTTTPPTDD